MYEQFFGFYDSPFNITPDPRFLFFSGRHQEAFGHLLISIEERKGFNQSHDAVLVIDEAQNLSPELMGKVS